MTADSKTFKPVRNPVKKGEKYEPVTPQKLEGTVPPLTPERLTIERDYSRKAKQSHLCLNPDGHKAVRVEYWLPSTHEYEDTLNPNYWGSVSTLFSRAISTANSFAGSIICVRKPDHSFYAELYVTEVTKGAVFVEPLFYKEFGLQLSDLKSSKVTVQWNEPVGGYDIIRNSDKAIIGQAKEFKRLDAVKNWLDKMG